VLKKVLLFGKSPCARRAGAVRSDIDEGHMKRDASFERGRASGADKARVHGSSWRRTPVFIFAVLAFQIGILGCFQVQAQIGDRTFSGRVTSSSGTPVANTRLILKNGASSDTRSVTVNSDGTYSAADLLPGIYQVTASAQGFEDTHATVAISSDSKPVLNLVVRAARGQRGVRDV
jgi:hypothetical protein